MLIFCIVLAGLIVLAGVFLTVCFMKSCDESSSKDLLDWKYGIYANSKAGGKKA